MAWGPDFCFLRPRDSRHNCSSSSRLTTFSGTLNQTKKERHKQEAVTDEQSGPGNGSVTLTFQLRFPLLSRLPAPPPGSQEQRRKQRRRQSENGKALQLWLPLVSVY